MSDDNTMIPVQKPTREQVKKLGTKGETYDEILQRLIRFYRKNKPNNKH